MRSDGAGQVVRLTNSPNAQWATSFSPDGRRLLYTQDNPPNHSDLWTLTLADVEGDRPTVAASEAFLQTPFDEDSATVSPDGHWVAYDSDESGRRGVYVRPLAGQGGKWAVSTDGGAHPVWSRAKPELLYSTEGGIMVVNYTSSGQKYSPGKPQVWLKKTVVDFDLAADGRRCIVVQKETAAEPGLRQLTFLLNFFGELHRRIDVAR
jgi:serine/threonine-protein kinase